ncbi:hypothetical protein [Polyangium fumosum]|uniref:Uncharacterized protein n=1 Tax=Polyangium fumosum TaxID=889272 RepID=A0A4U1J8U1_9BACT|nr:hypothetical protein [Polyangium fumosum]TKD03811.1 hypothetical protein E8A74_24815 [Polyangium fumosum]
MQKKEPNRWVGRLVVLVGVGTLGLMAALRPWQTPALVSVEAVEQEVQKPREKDARVDVGPRKSASPPRLPHVKQAIEIVEERAEEDEEAPKFVEKVVREDPALAEIYYFRQHVLLDPIEREQYHELLADEWMLDKVRKDLLHPPEIHETVQGNTKRLMEIDFLRDAVAWAENPSREEVLSTIEAMILADNYPDGMGMDMRISISGNKMELYSLLYEFAPERAAGLVDKARGTKVAQLVEYLSTAIPARKQRELANAITP